jgi:diamine N-acetyltransferase
MANVSLREIDASNREAVADLEVSQGQLRFVDTAAMTLLEAAGHEPAPWLRAIYADEEPVGLIMVAEHDPAGPWPYYLWRLLVDEQHQGRGYGRQAMAMLVERLRSLPDAEELVSSVATYDDMTDSPMGFYEGLGFVRTGEFNEHEELIKLKLR